MEEIEERDGGRERAGENISKKENEKKSYFQTKRRPAFYILYQMSAIFTSKRCKNLKRR